MCCIQGKKVTLSLCDVMTVWEGEETDEIS
jgi:hypothetical protein